MDRINVVGVQFRRAGRIYDFLTGAHDLRVGDDVVVDTERGPSLAKVAKVDFALERHFRDKELKSVTRRATEEDLLAAGRLSAEYCVAYTRERVDSLDLKMTVLQSEVQFGGTKVIVYFSAPGRVDFRDLVKELASGLKARVELKQVGARDEAKLVGGLGICGREFCCSSFLREFVPVSIKMAKNQNLALNPTKVSGGCGRLLCCLTYENDQYKEMRRLLPSRGTAVRSIVDNISGTVVKGDVLNQVVVIEASDGRYLNVKVAELELLDNRNIGQNGPDRSSDSGSGGSRHSSASKLAGDYDSGSEKSSRQSGSRRSQTEPVLDDAAVAWADDIDLEALTDSRKSSEIDRAAGERPGSGRTGPGRTGPGRTGSGHKQPEQSRSGRPASKQGRSRSTSREQSGLPPGRESENQDSNSRNSYGEESSSGPKKRRRRRRGSRSKPSDDKS